MDRPRLGLARWLGAPCRLAIRPRRGPPWAHPVLTLASLSPAAAALGVISNPVGALLSGLLVELLGRRGAIQLTAIPYVVGWICMALARHMTLLCLGRFISGTSTSTPFPLSLSRSFRLLTSRPHPQRL